MATSINIRIDDSLELKLKQAVNCIKKKSIAGSEVSNSTVCRAAIKEFVDRILAEEN